MSPARAISRGGARDEPPARRAQRDDAPLLEVRELRTHFTTDQGVVRAVDGVSFALRAGEALGIVGESGSGKSVTALSIMRLLEDGAEIAGGEIVFRGRNVVALRGQELRQLRGGDVAMIFQDPMTSLNPVLRIARQLIEGLLVHGRYTARSARERAVSLLGRMGITTPERAIDAYPHEFSGGMRQRVMLAMGFGNDPALLIADEPTTALDVTIQAQILDLLRELNADFGAAILLISHDLGVIANVCARTVVMYAGEVVEEGATAALLAEPRHPYTWALLNAAPRIDRHVPGEKRLTTIEGAPPDPLAHPPGCRFAPRCPFRIERCDQHPELLPVGDGRRARCWVAQAGERLSQRPPAAVAEADARTGTGHDTAPILEVAGLVKHFPLRRATPFSPKQFVHAVDGVDFVARRGETVGLVGESGCGKSTIARLITRIHEPSAGTVRFEGRDISHASRAEIRPLRRRMQMIFQDPYASLNPRMTVGEILAEPLLFHGITEGTGATRARVQELLALVGLSPRAAESYPHEFSGGQRQRIGTARALAVEPALIVADEPISSLDVNIQAQIINLFVDLQERFALTFLFIAHDLAVVRHVSDRIVVLYLGKVMEVASAAALFEEPLHPYTVSLISAVPVPEVAAERSRERIRLTGEPPSAVEPPSGCRFRTRCPIARQVCAEVVPPLAETRLGHFAACHFAGELSLRGSIFNG
jgi:peptide/nickel transport system ATP-binding protein